MVRGPRPADGLPRRPMSKVIALRVPSAVAAAMAAEAARGGTTAGTVARRALAAAFTADPGDVQPVRAYRKARPRPAVDVVEVGRLREVVGEVGGNLTRLARAAREAGYAAVHREMEAEWARVHAAGDALDALKLALEEAAP